MSLYKFCLIVFIGVVSNFLIEVGFVFLKDYFDCCREDWRVGTDIGRVEAVAGDVVFGEIVEVYVKGGSYGDRWVGLSYILERGVFVLVLFTFFFGCFGF